MNTRTWIVSSATFASMLVAASVHARFLQADPVGYKDDLNLYAYVDNDPANNVDPSGNTCTAVSTDAATGATQYQCQVDSMKNADGSVTQRKDFSTAQVKQVAAFEKSYTAAVSKLASDPSAKATVSVPGGRSVETTAGYVARAAASRMVEAAPLAKNTTAAATTHGDGVGGIATTVNAKGLSGNFNMPGLSDSDAKRQLVITHEAMHGGYIDNTRGGLSVDEFRKVHQDPYNNAALQLLNDDD